MWEIVFTVFFLPMELMQKNASWTNPVAFLFQRYLSVLFSIPQDIPLKAITSLGINFCTASLGLEVSAKMSEREVVTVTGAAGGTGLAATELSLSRHHPVCFKITYFYRRLCA